MIQTHNLIINSVYTSTPKKLINSEEIIKDLQDEKEYFQESYKKFGIYNRYVSGPEENFEDLSLEACSNLFQKSRISPSEISLLVVVSQTSSSRLPNSGHVIQNSLGLDKNCIIFDLNDGCNGYINGLILMNRFLKKDERGLLIAGDLMSQYTHNDDISNKLLMGDAVSGTIVTKSDNKCGSFIIKNDGSSAYSIRLEKKDQTLNFQMDGFKVFSFTMGKIPKLIKSFVSDLNESFEDYDYLVPHQANMILLENIRKKLKLQTEDFLYSLKDYGNTGPASIPVTLSTNKVKEGSKILLIGFGAGLSWGAISFNEFSGGCLNYLE